MLYFLAVQGKLYAVRSLGMVECYNPENDAWTYVSSMPDLLVKFSACESQGMIYVMGGFTTRDKNTELLRYSPTSDTWTTVQLCSMHICEHQMVSVEDTIYLGGGFETEKQILSWEEYCLLQSLRRGDDTVTMWSYNVTTHEWLHKKSKWHSDMTSTLHNDGIYIMSRYVQLHDNPFLMYNIFSNDWEYFQYFLELEEITLLCSLYLPNDKEN
ncbi:kelch-like protein 42 [Dunckerocampus dactyliophorus]|uniref:kelch-like protein 42 n=1 Tax=Dunckerocampus dactyliophorus TaxID=161453 RepID=UPI002405D3C1|nr:kelch-like protein 42 [Dunckerocampus dactyliophorus]